MLYDPANDELISDTQIQQTLLQRAHLAGHYGAEAMYKSIRYSGHYWPKMRAECLEVYKSCQPCQRFSIAKHGYHPLTSIVAMLPFDHIAIDLKEYKESNLRNCYCLVVVDVCTRFLFLRVLSDKSSYSVASELF